MKISVWVLPEADPETESSTSNLFGGGTDRDGEVGVENRNQPIEAELSGNWS